MYTYDIYRKSQIEDRYEEFCTKEVSGRLVRGDFIVHEGEYYLVEAVIVENERFTATVVPSPQRFFGIR